MWARLSLAQSVITRLCCYFCCPLPGSKNHVIMWRFLELYFHVSLLLPVTTFTSRKHQHLQRAFCCGPFGARLRHGWRWAIAFAVGQPRWNERAVTGRWDLPTSDQTTEWVKLDPDSGMTAAVSESLLSCLPTQHFMASLEDSNVWFYSVQFDWSARTLLCDDAHTHI